MKRIINITGLLGCSLTAGAQTQIPGEQQPELMRSAVAVIIIYLVASFILSLIRILLDDRLKKKMIEKGVPGEVIANMLPRNNHLIAAVKWICILVAVAAGLAIISNYPLSIYSVIIMAVSVALGLLVYYFWAKRIRN
ncbi:hypothetical protein [Chitinophaga solisilvae]|uniref:Uncharacterized protein n=1 Tax=Chitinophaga solisilvae TaxID=1233460 RepID=A0A433WQ04_9BACT|nr:hypothetical protein [Chitinophaga solisilvae]NSL90985.1 hypothetical protein [Chitinophaga solisilvae]